MELYGCQGCISPLGMENGAIADYQITASSQLDKYHAASRARLNIKLSGSMKGGWTARTEDLKQWLQVDLGSYTIVTRVATQGRNGYNQWVTKYRLLYAGNDGMNFHSYKELGDTSAKLVLHLSAWKVKRSLMPRLVHLHNWMPAILQDKPGYITTHIATNLEVGQLFKAIQINGFRWILVVTPW